MIGTCLSFLIRIELGSPGTQILANDTQLYNSAPFNYLKRRTNKDIRIEYYVKWIGNIFVTVPGSSNEVLNIFNRFPRNRKKIRHILVFTCKTPNLPIWGQLKRDNSIFGNLSVRMIESYNLYGEDNEPLSTCNTGLSSRHLSLDLFLKNKFKIVMLLFVGIHICVMYEFFIWSNSWVISNNHNAWGHLSRIISVSIKNTGSPDRSNSWGDGGFIIRKLRFVKEMERFYKHKYTSQLKNINLSKKYSKVLFKTFSLGNRIRNFSTSCNFLKETSSRKKKEKMLEGILLIDQLTKDNINNKELINKNIIKMVSNVDILIAAYSKIKSKPGNMSPGVDKETLDGINHKWFLNLEKELHSGTFKFKPSRRVEIPKESEMSTRLISVASPRDKIVQAAMHMVLEAIYEPTFSDHSHGFRPNRSCHTGLKEIRNTFSGVNWFIEGDISKCFDSFDHSIIVKEISKRIDDQGFKDLLYKSLKAGYLHQGEFFPTDLGTPQGSVLSPLICNILLHNLDKWLEEKQSRFNIGKRRRVNPVWAKLTREGKQKEIHRLNIGSMMPNDDKYKRMCFVRYADDFIIGVLGSKKDAIQIRNEVKDFLNTNLGLILNLEKTKISHARTELASFLGTLIRITPLEKRPTRLINRDNQVFYSRPSTYPQLLAPISKIVKKLEKRGICRHGGNPTRWGRMIPFEIDQIVNHFHSIWRGLSYYYSFANNYGSLGRIAYILKYSCILTLASKLRLKTKAKVFKKYGRDINIIKDGKIVASFPTPSLSRPNKFYTSVDNPFERLEKLSRATFRSKTIFNSNCYFCGISENLEMHHVRKIKDSSKKIKKDYYTAMMSRINRKQIPVCRSCHIKLHKGIKLKPIDQKTI